VPTGPPPPEFITTSGNGSFPVVWPGFLSPGGGLRFGLSGFFGIVIFLLDELVRRPGATPSIDWDIWERVLFPLRRRNLGRSLIRLGLLARYLALHLVEFLPSVPFELTAKNKALLRQFESEDLKAKLLFLPDQLVAEVTRIANGFSAGGLSYGYLVVRELDEWGDFTRGKRSIKQDEAAIVRRIFAEYAAGKSRRRIAADLNADRIASPRGGQWNASTINGHRGRRNGILQNELYKGQIVYNRVRMVKDPETGKRISRINSENEWVRVEAPELRNISDELWDAAQRTKRRYRDQPAQNCRRPKRLLSGLLRCGQCGGAFTIVRPGKYGCATHREKGTCANASQRRALLLLKNEKVELERAIATYHHCEPPPVSDVAKLFRQKVERLEESLGAEPAVTSQAATILRTLINGIVLYPRKKRGTMSIEVQGEPSALFFPANDEVLEKQNWMITVVAEDRSIQSPLPLFALALPAI
jgi:hypothetical protein